MCMLQLRVLGVINAIVCLLLFVNKVSYNVNIMAEHCARKCCVWVLFVSFNQLQEGIFQCQVEGCVFHWVSHAMFALYNFYWFFDFNHICGSTKITQCTKAWFSPRSVCFFCRRKRQILNCKVKETYSCGDTTTTNYHVFRRGFQYPVHRCV